MSSLTFSIKVSKKAALKAFLEQLGYKFDERPNTIWIGRDETTVLTLYQNNRLLLQGREVAKMVEILKAGNFLVQPRAPKSTATGKAVKSWMGIDEAGKGDYFGPLAVAGFLVSEGVSDTIWKLGVKDSKQLSDRTVLDLAAVLKERFPPQQWTLVVINPKRYNALHAELKNLNRILAWGHARAIENILGTNECSFAISDKFGDAAFIKKALMQKGRSITVEQRERAEEDVGVAAASILARAEFLRRLEGLSKECGVDLPKGVSEDVIAAGREFVGKHGAERLADVAKMHFKTTAQILVRSKNH